MIRLWHRVGTFRALSVLVLLAGLVGGLVIADRQTQHKASAKPVNAADAAAFPQGSASPAASPSLSEQAEAQSKAQDAAAAAAAQAKAAEDEARKKKEEEASRATRPATTGHLDVGPVPSSCTVYSGNKQVGCTILVSSGYGLDQMPCLEKLWDRESHWNVHAENRSSGAYGIPQALPGSKMASVGPYWHDDAATQIKWGLGYIKGRYKTPCGAWAHSQSTGWY